MRSVIAVLALGVVGFLALGNVTACSSSASNLGCSCSVSVNGASKDLGCGDSACVGGMTATCGENGGTTLGAPCTSTVDAGSSGGTSSGGTSSGGTSSGSSSKCELFTCESTKDCGGVAPCFSTSGTTSYCYEQEGNADQCSTGTHSTTKTTSNGPTVICVPSSCPEPVNFLK